MLRKLLLVGLACSVCLLFAGHARAQVLDPTTLHYVCTSPTSCTSGPTTLITGSSIPTFNITIQPGFSGLPASGSGAATLYIIALVPSSSPSLSFSINGTAAVAASGTFTSGMLMDSGTGFLAASHFATANPDFSAFASASGQSGTTPTGFTVYVVSFNITVPGSTSGKSGNWNATGGTLLTVGSGGITGLPSAGFPKGTVLYAAMSAGTGGSLFSSTTTAINTTPLSAALTIVPEPGTMALFGSGLLALGGVLRHRLRKRVQ